MRNAMERRRGSRSFKTLATAAGAAGFARRACVLLVVVLGGMGFLRDGAAMFVTSPQKGVISVEVETTTATQKPKVREPSLTVRPEDRKLQMELREIIPVPGEERKVNSNVFARLSGETGNFKPVLKPATSVKSKHSEPRTIADPIERHDRIFSIGSWAFILACVGAAALGLLQIKKLTSSE